jgi:hypothetical protein
MRRPIAPALLPLIALLAFGCAAGRRQPRPADFSLRYEWNEGSLPPPYYYEYTIRIGPGPQGEIEYRPDYAANDPPVWTETIPIQEADLDALYALCAEKGVFTTDWRPMDSPPIGGSSDSMEITADGSQISIPSFVAGEQGANDLREVYEAINALVPREIWTALQLQGDQYRMEYLAGQDQ